MGDHEADGAGPVSRHVAPGLIIIGLVLIVISQMGIGK